MKARVDDTRVFLQPPLYKRVKRYLRFLLVATFGGLASAVLSARAAGTLGAWLGGLGWRLARTDRQRALDSLARAFPEKTEAERLALGKACFVHLGRMVGELVAVRDIDRALDQWVEWPQSAQAVVQEGLARGKGVIFVSGHLGSWELLARTVALHGHPCTTIAKETTDARTTALIERFRESGKLRSIWRGRDGAAKKMLKVLKGGEILGLLIDQDTDVQSVWVPFFGHPAKTPRAAADLALRTGATVIFGACRRVAPQRYALTMQDVPLPTEGDGEAKTLALTAELTRLIEEAIRAAPEQWVWMHRRWKSQHPSTSSG
jgi:Kdo2-lipid IVA lauroyltransferase/acyltransferase